MAIATQGFYFNISFVDTGGNVSSKTYQMTAPDYATAIADAAAALPLFEAVTDAEVSAYRVTEIFAEGTLTLPANAEIENQALITVGITGEPLKSATLTIPAPKAGIMTASSGEGYNVVDASDADLVAWLAMFSTGGNFTISDGEVASGFKGGRRIHRKSNRG